MENGYGRLGMKIVSVGEVLWDVIEQQEYLGGAPFNFAAHLHRLGHTIFFVSGVGRDERGERVLQRMTELGLMTDYVARVESAATGVVEVRLDTAGQPQFIIRRPAAYDFVTLPEAQLHRLSSGHPDWIYFGTLLHMSPQAKAVTEGLLAASGEARRFYDVNLRPGCYEAGLVRELMSQATAVKVNEDEAAEVAQMFQHPPHRSLEEFCRRSAREFSLEAVCVTRGARGCVLLIGDEYVEAEGYAVSVVDTVGSGDAFAAALVHGLSCGWRAGPAADFANRVGALVASRRGAIPDWTIAEANALKESSRTSL
jgi:fructokinase